MKSETFHLRLSDDERTRLKDAANATHLTESSVLRQLIARYLDTFTSTFSIPEQGEALDARTADQTA